MTVPVQPAEPAHRPIKADAIGSLVFGILWLGGVGSVLAIVAGHYALHQIRRSGGQLRGEGLAIAGLVLGYVGLIAAMAIYG